MSQKEVESLKGQITKLRVETEAHATAERKIEQLTAEINQLKLKEINRAKEEVEIERNMLAGEYTKQFLKFSSILSNLIYRKTND